MNGLLTIEEKALVADVILTAMLTRRAKAKQLGNTLIGTQHRRDVEVLSSALTKLKGIK